MYLYKFVLLILEMRLVFFEMFLSDFIWDNHKERSKSICNIECNKE